MTKVSDVLIHDLIIKEEQKSERFANYARLLFTLLYLIGGVSIKDEIPAHSFNILIILSSINFLYGILVWVLVRKEHYFPWLKYYSVMLDIIILSIFLYSIGTYRTFKTEACSLYYLWIALATIRFSPRLTFIAGALSIIFILFMTAMAIRSGSVTFGTITDSYVSEMVSLTNITIMLVMLTVFIAVAVYISSIFKRLVTKAINEMIISQENQALSSELENATKISEIDPLTQLYNRRKINRLLEETFANAKEGRSRPALIMVDIDHFKSINDQYGHLEGDKVLVQITRRLQHGVRKDDLLGRWGGEEFLIILPDTDIDTALFLGERLRKHVWHQLSVDEKSVSCSFGVTLLKDDDTIESFIRRADMALYLSKEGGRNRVTHL